MEEYHLFDEYLKKSKIVRKFCEDREKMLFESIRMDISVTFSVALLVAEASSSHQVRTSRSNSADRTLAPCAKFKLQILPNVMGIIKKCLSIREERIIPYLKGSKQKSISAVCCMTD